MGSGKRLFLLLTIVFGHFKISGQTTYRANTIAGYVDDWGDGGPATEAVLETPGGIAFDAAGDLYICEL